MVDLLNTKLGPDRAMKNFLLKMAEPERFILTTSPWGTSFLLDRFAHEAIEEPK